MDDIVCRADMRRFAVKVWRCTACSVIQVCCKMPVGKRAFLPSDRIERIITGE